MGPRAEHLSMDLLLWWLEEQGGCGQLTGPPAVGFPGETRAALEGRGKFSREKGECWWEQVQRGCPGRGGGCCTVNPWAELSITHRPTVAAGACP